MNIHRILAATDYSESSHDAIGAAASLARDHRATLILLHISQLEGYPVGELVDEEPQPPADEMEKLHVIAAQFPDVDCQCRWIHCDGSHEAEVILKTVEKENADMIVVGTHGRHGLSHVLMGSVAEQVVRDAKCPVLTVRQSEPAELETQTSEVTS